MQRPKGILIKRVVIKSVVICATVCLALLATGHREARTPAPTPRAIARVKRGRWVPCFFKAAPDGTDAATLDTDLKSLPASGLFEMPNQTQRHASTVRVVEGRCSPASHSRQQEGAGQAAHVSGAIKAGGTLRATVQSDVERIREIYRSVGCDDVAEVPAIISQR